MEKARIKKSNKKTILFLSWRDIKAPKMGGAEIYTHEMLSRMDKEKYRILHFSPLFKGSKEIEEIDGVTYYREGSVISVISKARKFYKRNISNIDYVVNQCNTHRFFTKFWVNKNKRIFFIHQLTREIWFYHARFPFNYIGYLLEKPMLKLNKNDLTITVSKSTKNELIDLGFNSNRIEIIPEGLDFEPWDKTLFKDKKEEESFIYVGRFAEYKGIDDALKAFAMVKKEKPDCKFWIVGKPNNSYIKKKLDPICRENLLRVSYKDDDADVIYKGFVTEDEKLDLMSRSTLLIFPSIREGWGLTISEAGAVGTPSLVYDAPGTRDAIENGNSGYMCRIGDINGLKELMSEALTCSKEYYTIRDRAYEFSKSLHWDSTGKSFTDFCNQRL